MEKYPVETLWEAHNAGYGLWALCRACGHVARFDAYDLIKKTHDTDRQLWAVSKRLKCKPCGTHTTVLIPSAKPDWSARARR